jgi:hypothetical protein
MSWNYRSCTWMQKGYRCYAILPIYYDKDGNIDAVGQQFITICDSLEDLKSDIALRSAALEKEVVDLNKCFSKFNLFQ